MRPKARHLLSLIAAAAVIVFAIAVFNGDKPVKAQSAAKCSTAPVNSTSLIKTYHLRDDTYGFGVFPTKDGGYALTGEAVWSGGMQAPYPYVVRIDAKGNNLWTRDFSSPSNALGSMSSSHFGRLAVETSDGSIITASDVVDFVDENTKELYGDILVTKLNSKGAQAWSVMLGDYSIDRPQKIWALPNGEVLLWARFMETGHGNDVADTEAVAKHSVLIRIDKNGKVLSSKKMNWDALDMQRLADGSFIALANIAVPKTEQPENIVGPEAVMGDLPTVIRLDSNLKVLWAKSLEMIPSEINTPTSYANNTLTMGKTVIRMAGGDFRMVQQTPDGGFLAFGFANQILTQGLSGRAAISLAELSLRPLTAVKLDAAGNYQWTKKMTADLVSGGSVNDFHVVKTADNNFVIMKNTVRDNSSLASSTVNIGLIKTDADFNPIWIKRIDTERELSGYSLQPTADKGVVVAGSMITNKMHMVLGTLVPYTEAALIKVDANGAAPGCVSISNRTGATLEDQSRYLVTQNMEVAGAENSALPINKKVKEKVAAAKNAVKNICQYLKNKATPICSHLTPDSSANLPAGQTVTTPVAKTWAEINFENAKEAKIGSARNQGIHDELLPILKKISNDQVKLTDSMDSMWLTYYFPRPVTRADVEAVQKYYEGLGYKIDESEGGRLYVSRVGLTLHFTFFISESMKGKIEVLF